MTELFLDVNKKESDKEGDVGEAKAVAQLTTTQININVLHSSIFLESMLFNDVDDVFSHDSASSNHVNKTASFSGT